MRLPLLVGAVAALLVSFAFAAQARGATLDAVIVSDPELPDYCGHSYAVRYNAGAGERNDLQFSFTNGIEGPALTFGPFCWMASKDESLVSDLTAPISAQGEICRNSNSHVGRCTAYLIVGLAVNTADRRDLIKVGPENPVASVSAGSGDDAVNTANGQGGDRISCGAGDDTATVDPGDEVDADCEQVSRLG